MMTSDQETKQWVGWLIFLASSGMLAACGPVAGSTTSDASGSEVSAAESGGNAPGTSPLWDGVRVYRGFFEDGGLTGELKIVSDADSSTVHEVPSSSVQWRIEAPTSAAPAAGYVADFRERAGCAGFAGGIDLCFETAPDISTITINAKKASVRGLERAVAAAVGGSCSPVVRYLGSSRDEASTGLQVSFSVSGCGAGPMRAEFGLRSISLASRGA